MSENIFILRKVFSEAECRDFIARAELSGFDAQVFRSVDGLDARHRAAFDDPEGAGWIWERVQSYLPPLETLYLPPLVPEPSVRYALSAYQSVGLNPRLRFYLYQPGERFPWHSDNAFEVSDAERTFLTCIVYLNDACRGGETRFENVTVNPEIGSVLFFPHELLHEGMPVQEGQKVVLRSDVMYRVTEFSETIG